MKALITGITGQDGSYLAELLLGKGYEVHGITRQSLSDREKLWRIVPIQGKLLLYQKDVASREDMHEIFQYVQPDEVYHLAGQKQSHDFEKDFATFPLNIDATRIFLSLIKEFRPTCRFFFAGSCEMFGRTAVLPQNEMTPFSPISPYGVSKVVGHWIVKMYREVHGVFACTGILFNHESPRRGFDFVTRKITSAVARIKVGAEKELRLGNLDAKRDWGFAGDYAEAMWMMLQDKNPDDYIIGTGETHNVREFTETAFSLAGLDWKRYVKTDRGFSRPIEAHIWRADPTKIRVAIGWRSKTTFIDLVRMMVEHDLDINKAGQGD